MRCTNVALRWRQQQLIKVKHFNLQADHGPTRHLQGRPFHIWDFRTLFHTCKPKTGANVLSSSDKWGTKHLIEAFKVFLPIRSTHGTKFLKHNTRHNNLLLIPMKKWKPQHFQTLCFRLVALLLSDWIYTSTEGLLLHWNTSREPKCAKIYLHKQKWGKRANRKAPNPILYLFYKPVG